MRIKKLDTRGRIATTVKKDRSLMGENRKIENITVYITNRLIIKQLKSL